LPIAFGITMMVRIAQGSATVAMITAVGIVAPVVAGGALGFNPLYLALAIGCGSKPIPWMNDSGFWIITKMSGFEEGETLKTASVMMSMMGFVGLIVTVLAAWLVPLV
jgi:GntP family gluconate:H+ symporter